MNKSDWLLLAIGERMEPIQIQKTMFKFVNEAEVPTSEAYQFRPYNWGPCSFEIYDDLQSLRLDGKVETIPTGRGWSTYRLTELGRREAEVARANADENLAQKLAGIRQWVTSKSFGELLREVYRDYPTYATESIFAERSK